MNSEPYISYSDWIGIDFAEAEPVACVLRYSLFGKCIFKTAGIKQIRELRSNARCCIGNNIGSRCAVAAPVDKIFTEKIAVEGVPKRKAADFVLGKLDISLPLPVEECIVEATEIKDESIPSFTTFALPVSAYDTCRTEISNALGFNPEAIVPAAAAVWAFLPKCAIEAQEPESPRAREPKVATPKDGGPRSHAAAVPEESSDLRPPPSALDDGRACRPATAATHSAAPKQAAAISRACAAPAAPASLGPMPEKNTRLHLSLSSRHWFIAAGRSSLENVVSTPVGDLAALARNIAIISMRFENPLITASGSCADAALVEALAKSGNKIFIVQSPKDFLARAIAYYGSLTGKGKAVNFNSGERAHPAAVWEACGNAFFKVLFLLVAPAALVLIFRIHDFSEAKAKLTDAETKLSATAEQLAGRSLGVEPLVAIELAKNEFAKKLNQDVEAFTKHDATGALAAVVKFAADNGVLLTKITVSDNELTAEADHLESAKVRDLGAVLARAGFKMEVAPGTAFKATVKPAEGGDNE